MATPVERFVADLTAAGAPGVLRQQLVFYEIEPVTGSRCGQLVHTAVEVAELASWPVAPPHWIHLPGDIAFPVTNSQQSAAAGWLRHSRQIAGWGNEAAPIRAWLAHVRGILGEAV